VTVPWSWLTLMRQWCENLVETLCYQVQQQITAFEDNTS
jgi:hypothetical protein